MFSRNPTPFNAIQHGIAAGRVVYFVPGVRSANEGGRTETLGTVYRRSRIVAVGKRVKPTAWESAILGGPSVSPNPILALNTYSSITYEACSNANPLPDVYALGVVYTSGERNGFRGNGAGLGT